jgi:hypothetical protein
MSANKHMADNNLQLLRVRARTAPLCYSRQATSEVIDQARINAQSNAVLMMFSVMTCAAAFLVVYGGWSF